MNDTTMAKLAKPLLLLATLIWGSSFVFMKNSLDAMPTFYLLAYRFTAAAVILALVFWKRWKVVDRQYWVGGGVMGFCLFLGYLFQTFGLEQTTPGKNAFLTAVYCVIVPFLYWFTARQRPDKFNLLAVFLCIAGIGLVSLSGSDGGALGVNVGDGLTLIGGFFFATHIVATNHYTQGRDVFVLTAIQFASLALCAWIGALTTAGPPPMVTDQSILMQLAYLVVFSSCGALLFQNIGQKYTPAATAGVLLSLEAPFGVLFSVFIANEPVTPLMILGFALIFVAVICSETKFSFLRKKVA